MREYLPLLIVGTIIGIFALVFVIAYAKIRKQKDAVGFDRNMPDGEISRRLLRYARRYWKNFALVLVIMLFSISSELLSPLIVGRVHEIVKRDFEMNELLVAVIIYAAVLILSMVSTYFQAIVLQKTGQKILSSIREAVFTHI